MRLGIMVVAAAALFTAVSANAATIVQFDSEAFYKDGFQGFDTRLGQLNNVTLDITINKSRVWQIDSAVPAGTLKTVDWAVDGLWTISGAYLQQAETLYVPITGQGTSQVTLGRTFGDRAYGYFEVFAFGAATLNLDPSGFVGQRYFFNGFDTGYHDATGADTMLTSVGDNRFLHLPGSCYIQGGVAVGSAEDLCGNAAYRLTYDYTPSGSVPEPATWAMMILGMGVVGYAMRRTLLKNAAIRRDLLC
jgi:hypothetical protein